MNRLRNNLRALLLRLQGKKVYRTKTGRVLTDVDIERLADEAEQGYDVRRLSSRH